MMSRIRDAGCLPRDLGTLMPSHVGPTEARVTSAQQRPESRRPNRGTLMPSPRADPRRGRVGAALGPTASRTREPPGPEPKRGGGFRLSAPRAARRAAAWRIPAIDSTLDCMEAATSMPS